VPPFGVADSCGSEEPCIRWGADLLAHVPHFEGDMYWPIVMLRRMMNVSAQQAQWANAFNTTRGDQTVMWPVIKLFWRFVFV